LALFDDVRAREVFPMAYEQGLALGEQLRVDDRATSVSAA
jgi:hypothetical protein